MKLIYILGVLILLTGCTQEITSTIIYKAGNYDIELDGNDDYFILDNTGLTIYDGANYQVFSTIKNYSEFVYKFDQIEVDKYTEFYITDFDADGIGDILIGNKHEVFFLKGKTIGESFTFIPESIINTDENIKTFGHFEVNGDIYKDILVLSANYDKWNFRIFDAQTLELNNTYTSNSDFDCNKYALFDLNNDFIQDIICYSSDKLKIFIRPKLTMDFNQWEIHQIETGFEPANNILIRNMDYDQDYEILLKARDNITISVYDYTGASIVLQRQGEWPANPWDNPDTKTRQDIFSSE